MITDISFYELFAWPVYNKYIVGKSVHPSSHIFNLEIELSDL
jgi:hypothetical protein